MLTDKETAQLDAILRRLYAAARESIDIKAGKKPSTIVIAYLREYVREFYRAHGDDDFDGRARPFEYILQIWDVATGEDRGELMAESDAERVKGLAAVCSAIAGHIADFHEDEALRDHVTADTLRRLPTFRTSLSVAGGEAMMRVRYESGGVPHLATARIARDKLRELDT